MSRAYQWLHALLGGWGSIKTLNVCIYIVANSGPPGVRSATPSNGDRLAHRTDNSVVALLGLSPETSHGRGFDPATSQSADYPCGIGSIAKVDIPIGTHTDTPPRGSTSPQADAGHEPFTQPNQKG